MNDDFMPPNRALSDEELLELEGMLTDKAAAETAMNIGMLHGYLTALVVGPVTVMPAVWMPYVWDFREGKTAPRYQSTEQALRAMQLMTRMNNELALVFSEDPESFEALWMWNKGADPADWCRGFLVATLHYKKYWKKLLDEHEEWFGPFLEVMENGWLDEIPESEHGAHIEKLLVSLDERLFDIYDYWLPQRGRHVLRAEAPVKREEPKVGRNDPCICGSGKKFKKCCGASANDDRAVH